MTPTTESKRLLSEGNDTMNDDAYIPPTAHEIADSLTERQGRWWIKKWKESKRGRFRCSEAQMRRNKPHARPTGGRMENGQIELEWVPPTKAVIALVATRIPEDP